MPTLNTPNTPTPNGSSEGHQNFIPTPLPNGSSQGHQAPPPSTSTTTPSDQSRAEQLLSLMLQHNMDPTPYTAYLDSLAQTPSTSQSSPPAPPQTLRMDTDPPSTSQKRPHTDSDGFTTVHNGAKQHKPDPPITPLTTANRFTPLAKLRPLPLILPRTEYEPSQISQWLTLNYKQTDYQLQMTKTETKILPTTEEARTRILTLFQKCPTKVSYYTYAPKGTPLNKKFIIHGLDINHPLENVKEALAHPDLIYVNRLTKSSPSGLKTPIEPILVTFKPTYDPKNHILTIRSIDQIIIHTKPYNPQKSIPQCHRCQRYGHTKNHCYLPPRCVRCTGPHNVSDCDRATQKLKCANCHESHPANYTLCRSRLELLHETQSRKAPAAAPAPRSFIPAPPPTTNAWTTRSQNFLPAQNPPITLPLPTPQAAPAPPLIPQPPIHSYNTPPPWMDDLKTMFSNMMNTLTRLLDLLLATMSK